VLDTDRIDHWTPTPLAWVDWLIAGVSFAAVLAVLALTDQMGIPRDESYYFHAANEYGGWFRELWTHWHDGQLWESFTKANVDKHWSYNSEHPALMKTLFALSRLLFADSLGWLSKPLAMRLPAMATGAALVSGTYLFGRQIYGRLAGAAAALAVLLQPRLFFHAHLACFDVPITFCWLGVVYAYWRSLDSRRWAVACGLLFGLALSVKLNAFFLPVVLTGHWLATNGKEIRLRRADPGWSIRLPALPWALIAMALLGPIVFYATNPRFWFDTYSRVASYMSFHFNHVHYFVHYFGQNLKYPPLPVSYPWVMTLVTVPATILIAAALGGVHTALIWDPIDWGRRWLDALSEGRLPDCSESDPRGTGLLLTLNLLFPIALIAMPETPIFGGTKHWMPAMPFLALFAGAGVALAHRLLCDRLGAASLARAVAVAATVAVLAPAAYATAHIHPFGTSYYNAFIGSIRGAADHRMFRQFWGYAGRQSLPWLNEHAPDGARVITHNTTGFAWRHYTDQGDVRNDLRTSGLDRADFALFHHQRSFTHRRDTIWTGFGTFAPAHVVSLEGVPLLSIYRRPGTDERSDRRTPPGPVGGRALADAWARRGCDLTPWDAGSASTAARARGGRDDEIEVCCRRSRDPTVCDQTRPPMRPPASDHAIVPTVCHALSCFRHGYERRQQWGDRRYTARAAAPRPDPPDR